jgi:hypothetical protein
MNLTVLLRESSNAGLARFSLGCSSESTQVQFCPVAARYKIPVGGFASQGGLMSYNIDLPDQIRIAAGFVG